MRLSTLSLLFLVILQAHGQDTKRVILSAKSNIDTSEVAEGFHKYCPNVLVTQDPAKADYVLEAAETVVAAHGNSSRKWHFALLNREGDVLFTTHPRASLAGRAHHFEETCKFINGANKRTK